MKDTVLAVSAGHAITEQELEDLIANYPPDQQAYFLGQGAREELLEQLIGFYLFAALADEQKIKESKAYQETLSKMAQELAGHMAATGVMEQAAVDDSAAREYFDAHPEQFLAGVQVRASHILVDRADAAERIAEEIAAGKAFADAAREYSTCPSKEKGGDLGYFGKGQMVPEFEKAAFGAQAGETVGPVKTQFGYHLIRVEDQKKQEGVEFSDIKERLKEKLLQQKKQEVYRQTLKELEDKYGVERMR